MSHIYNFIFFFTLTFFIYFLISKQNLFKLKKNNIHNKFSTQDSCYLIGGPIIFLFILYYFFNNTFLVFFLFTILMTGILSDVRFFNQPTIRLVTQVIIVICAVYFLDLNIKSTKFLPLDFLLNYKIFNILFTGFCILIFINGCNFIDGLNNLLLTYILLILTNIIFFTNSINIDLNFLQTFSILLLVLIIFNFFGHIILGDSGAYILGFLVSFLLIEFSKNDYVSPYYIVLLLWYPCFEVLFSMIRRLSRNKKLHNPDTKHLHQLLYLFIKSKIKTNKNLTHWITVMSINIYNFVIFFIGAKKIYSSQYIISFIILNIIVYNFIYYLLFSNLVKKKGI